MKHKGGNEGGSRGQLKHKGWNEGLEGAMDEAQGGE